MRVFVAVRPDERAVEHLGRFLEPRYDAAPGVGWRWAPADQWHLTLAFCADVEEWRVEELTELLSDVAARRTPPTLRLEGGGAFPHADGARVLWADVAGDREVLADLSRASRAACNRAGAAVDGDRFRPHLTLARLGRAGQVGDWVKLLDSYAGPEWPASHLEVVASHLGEGPRRGARHEVLAELPLDG